MRRFLFVPVFVVMALFVIVPFFVLAQTSYQMYPNDWGQVCTYDGVRYPDFSPVEFPLGPDFSGDAGGCSLRVYGWASLSLPFINYIHTPVQVWEDDKMVESIIFEFWAKPSYDLATADLEVDLRVLGDDLMWHSLTVSVDPTDCSSGCNDTGWKKFTFLVEPSMFQGISYFTAGQLSFSAPYYEIADYLVDEILIAGYGLAPTPMPTITPTVISGTGYQCTVDEEYHTWAVEYTGCSQSVAGDCASYVLNSGDALYLPDGVSMDIQAPADVWRYAYFNLGHVITPSFSYDVDWSEGSNLWTQIFQCNPEFNADENSSGWFSPHGNYMSGSGTGQCASIRVGFKGLLTGSGWQEVDGFDVIGGEGCFEGTATPTLTPTATSTGTITPTITPSVTLTPTVTSSPTSSPTPWWTPEATSVWTPEPGLPTATSTPLADYTPGPVSTPSVEVTVIPSPVFTTSTISYTLCLTPDDPPFLLSPECSSYVWPGSPGWTIDLSVYFFWLVDVAWYFYGGLSCSVAGVIGAVFFVVNWVLLSVFSVWYALRLLFQLLTYVWAFVSSLWLYVTTIGVLWSAGTAPTEFAGFSMTTFFLITSRIFGLPVISEILTVIFALISFRMWRVILARFTDSGGYNDD